MAQAEHGGHGGTGKVITDVLGDHPKTQIIFTLISEARSSGEYRDLNVSDIARMSGLDRSTVYDHLDTLLETGIVEQSREIGNSKMYQINRDSQAAKGLAQFDHARVMGESHCDES